VVAGAAATSVGVAPLHVAPLDVAPLDVAPLDVESVSVMPASVTADDPIAMWRSYVSAVKRAARLGAFPAIPPPVTTAE
jgi:hypothetical protein